MSKNIACFPNLWTHRSLSGFHSHLPVGKGSSTLQLILKLTRQGFSDMQQSDLKALDVMKYFPSSCHMLVG
jgi:hypothetical protein